MKSDVAAFDREFLVFPSLSIYGRNRIKEVK